MTINHSEVQEMYTMSKERYTMAYFGQLEVDLHIEVIFMFKWVLARTIRT